MELSSVLCNDLEGWKGGSRGREYINMYTYSWFTLLYVRNWHNIVKQLYSNYNIKFFLIYEKRNPTGHSQGILVQGQFTRDWIAQTTNLYCSQSWRLGSPRCQQILYVVNAASWFGDGHLNGILTRWGAEKESKFSRLFLFKGLIPFIRTPPHDLLTLQRPHLLMLSYGESGFQPMNLEDGWETNISP